MPGAEYPSSDTRSPRLEPDHPASSRQAVALTESLARLEQAVAAIQDSATFRRYLEAQARFHTYSWRNVLLLHAQREGISRVAGYRTWQRLHRQVRRGEPGLRILVPMSHAIRSDPLSHEPAGSSDAARPARRVFFGIGYVWDISQTDGEPLLRVEVPELTSLAGRPLHEKLVGLATSEGLSVRSSYELLPAGVMGAYDRPRRAIMLREAAPLQMTKTLAHELAHHFNAATASTPAEETIAESVAYVVLARYGLDSGERSFPYVAVWSREPGVLTEALARIQGLSARLIDQVEAQATSRKEL